LSRWHPGKACSACFAKRPAFAGDITYGVYLLHGLPLWAIFRFDAREAVAIGGISVHCGGDRGVGGFARHRRVFDH